MLARSENERASTDARAARWGRFARLAWLRSKEMFSFARGGKIEADHDGAIRDRVEREAAKMRRERAGWLPMNPQ